MKLNTFDILQSYFKRGNKEVQMALNCRLTNLGFAMNLIPFIVSMRIKDKLVIN